MIPDKVTKTLIDFTLGDGSIRKEKETWDAIFKMEHSIKQREYLWHKVQILQSFGLVGHEHASIRKLKDRDTNYGMISYTFRRNSAINTAYKWCYNGGRKSIDKALLRQLDDISLAYWFMDDGSGPKTYKSVSKINGVRYVYTYEKPKIEHYSFSTYNCTLNELQLIQSWLLSEFGVKTRLKLDKRAKTCYGAFIVTCGVDGKDALRKVLEPHIIPSMRYKIDAAHTFSGMQYKSVQRDRLSEETPFIG